MKLEFCTVTGSGAQSGLATLRASSVVNAASHFCANEPILLVANQLKRLLYCGGSPMVAQRRIV